jgi:hypothetical protein
MGRQWEPGSYWRLRLPGTGPGFGYARLAEEPYAAFLDLGSAEPIVDVAALQGVARAFVTAVETRCLDRWDPLGPDPAGAPLDDPPRQYHRSRDDPERCTIFEVDGTVRPASPQECAQLEPMAVWNASSVAQRLLDHLMGRPNADLEALREPD